MVCRFALVVLLINLERSQVELHTNTGILLCLANDDFYGYWATYGTEVTTCTSRRDVDSWKVGKLTSETTVLHRKSGPFGVSHRLSLQVGKQIYLSYLTDYMFWEGCVSQPYISNSFFEIALT